MSDPTPSSASIELDSLEVPYSRSDLLLIAQAASNLWPTDAAAKAAVVAGVIRTRDCDAVSARTRRSAIRCLATLAAWGWPLE